MEAMSAAPQRRPQAGHAPVVLSVALAASRARERMEAAGQAMAFVAGPHGLVGVVTLEDLGFAVDWARPTATVADAVTLGVVEVGRGSSHHDATEAFSAALRAWMIDRASGLTS